MVASLVCLNALLLSLPVSAYLYLCFSVSLSVYISFWFGGIYDSMLGSDFIQPLCIYIDTLASVQRDFALKATTTITMISSKCYSENRFEMAFKIRHTKLWTANAIKMHKHFYIFSIVARAQTHIVCTRAATLALAHHSHTIKQINRAILIRNWSASQPASAVTHIKYSYNTHILWYRKELLFAVFFYSVSQAHTEWMKKKSLWMSLFCNSFQFMAYDDFISLICIRTNSFIIPKW